MSGAAEAEAASFRVRYGKCFDGKFSTVWSKLVIESVQIKGDPTTVRCAEVQEQLQVLVASRKNKAVDRSLSLYRLAPAPADSITPTSATAKLDAAFPFQPLNPNSTLSELKLDLEKEVFALAPAITSATTLSIAEKYTATSTAPLTSAQLSDLRALRESFVDPAVSVMQSSDAFGATTNMPPPLIALIGEYLLVPNHEYQIILYPLVTVSSWIWGRVCLWVCAIHLYSALCC